MAHPMGESKEGVLRLDFDRRLKLEFHGSKVTSDAGLLPYRELDDAVGLSEIAGDALTDTRRGKNGRHGLVAQFRQSVFGRLGGYDDVNDADRLSLDPVMRWIVGGHVRTAVTNYTTERNPQRESGIPLGGIRTGTLVGTVADRLSLPLAFHGPPETRSCASGCDPCPARIGVKTQFLGRATGTGHAVSL